jgi:hypothetical protein
MSSYRAIAPPKRNTNANQGMPWFQEGYSYGRNDSGPFQTWNTEGWDADVDADALNFLLGGWTYTVIRMKGGKSRMEAHAGWTGGQSYTSEVLENIWELDPNDEGKALLEADFPYGSINISYQKTRAAIALLVDDSGAKWLPSPPNLDMSFQLSSGVWYIFSPGTDTDTEVYLPAADGPSAYSLYCLLKAKVSEFPVEASVIRHTQLVSNQYTVQASFSNVKRIISSASMVSIEGVPTTLLFGVPNPQAPSQFIEVPGDLQYGWKKSRPGVTRLALFKWRIVQNWQLGLWPVKLFGSVL